MEPPEVRIEIDPMEDREREDDEEMEIKRTRRSKRRNSIDQPSMATAPAHVHGNEWKDMINMADLLTEPTAPGYDSRAFERARARSNTKAQSWIEQTILKRECVQFIPSQKYLNKCGCGRTVEQHSFKDEIQSPERRSIEEEGDPSIPRMRWSIKKHTAAMPTDAFGTIQFENVGVHSEARFARLSFDSDPSSIVRLLQGAWRMKAPKLIITIHGGLTNFELQPKLARALRRGIMKAAKSCDTWIITTGMHQGAVQHVCDALTDLRNSRKSKSKVAAIGIAPWGLIKKRNRLVGHNNNVRYTMNVFTNGRFLELDNAHSHFLLADNGTVGRYGAEVILRRRLESFLSTGSAPVVAVVVEGGCFAVKVAHDYLTSRPSIPVVVCDGSGRASDLLAFTHKYLEEEGYLPDAMRAQLLSLIKGTFDMDDAQAGRVLRQIVESAEKRELLNIFRLGEGMNDVDHAIFSALIKGTNMDQLKLALAWNRVDIAKSHIFGGNLIWSQLEMQEALMYVLLHNRVDFVHLILENGVGMQNFLTFERLEELYNSDLGPANTLHLITKSEEFTIPMIGAVVEKLIGRSFRSTYTSDEFLQRYSVWQSRAHFKAMSAKRTMPASRAARLSENMGTNVNRKKNVPGQFEDEEEEEDTTTEQQFAFDRPFHELLIWAVLTKRQDMAIAMWKHGEEALAKAMIASRLYTSLANNAADEFLELTLCDELRSHAETFQTLASDFIEQCYQMDDEMASSLLTYELTNWGSLTALALASNNHDRLFMKHPSCQNILNEIWHGGMVVQHSADFMVMASIFIPPLLLTLDFKSEEELQKAPQTTAEFEESIETDSDTSDSSSDSSYSEDESTSSEDEKGTGKRSRSNSINFSNFLSSARRSFRKNDDKKETIQQLAAHTLPGMFTSVALPASSPPSSDGVRTRTGTVQQKNSRNRKESENGVRSKISRTSTVKSSSRRGTVDTCSDMFECMEEEKGEIVKRKTPLKWTRKVTEFYSAPITTFYMWELAFFFFQTVLAYAILTRTDEERIHWDELYLIAYVVVFGCDLMRKFCYYDVRPFSLKLYKFFISFRNGSSILAVVTYCIGFGFRAVPGWVMMGRVIIIMNSVLWSLKFIEYLSVYRLIGPYIKTASEMIPTCIPMLTLLFVIMLSYGTVRQAITYPYEDWNIILIRNIFLKPYYMLYGEVYAAEIDTCNDGMWDYHLEQGIRMYDINDTSDPEWNCVPGHWVSPLYMTFFMIISFVLLMNSMIASCTWVYEHRVMYTKEIWLLERFRVVMDFESRPFLPPPFSIIIHIYTIFKYLLWRCSRKSKGQRFMDNTLKSFLTPEQLHALTRFESQVLEDWERKKEFAKKHSNDEHVVQSTLRTEQIFNQLNTMSTVKESARDLIRELDQRMSKLENDRKEHLDTLASIAAQLERLSSSRASSTAPPSYDDLRASPPRVFVRSASQESVDDEKEMVFGGEEEEETPVRKDSGRPSAIRHHSEYTTIADAIERPSTQRALHSFTRRRRISSSGEPNPNLFSVSEMDEFQPSDIPPSDAE